MCRPYSVLLPVGFAVPLLLPATRCALTAPFRPDRIEIRRYDFCGTFPDPSTRSGPPDVIRHRSSLEPGLSSPTQLPVKQRSPNPLAGLR